MSGRVDTLPRPSWFVGNEIVTSVLSREEAQVLPLAWHDEFDEMWGRASFHNRLHVETVLRGGIAYLANSSQEQDPLRVRADLDKWNASHVRNGEEIDFEVFKDAFLWTVKYHDTGNPMKGLSFENGILRPIYHRNGHGVYYVAKDAEDRSKEIFRGVMQHTDMGPDGDKTISLCEHLIDQTRLVLPEDSNNEPFSRFMHFMDQVGGCLSIMEKDRTRMILGLAEEFASEDPDKIIRPHDFFNYVRNVACALAGGPEELTVTLEILGKSLPDEEVRYSNKPVTVTEFLRQNSMSLAQAA